MTLNPCSLPVTASIGGIPTAIVAVADGNASQLPSGAEPFAQILQAIESVAAPKEDSPEDLPVGDHELPGGKIPPVGDIARLGISLAPASDPAVSVEAEADQAELPPGSPLGETERPVALVEDASAGECDAPHQDLHGEGSLPLSGEFAALARADLTPMLKAGLPASDGKDPAAARLTAERPLALGLRARTAEGEALPRGIGLAETRHERHAAMREAIQALLEQSAPGHSKPEAATGPRGAEAIAPAARVELPAVPAPGSSVAASSQSPQLASAAPSAAVGMEALIDTLSTARENGRVARGDVVLRHAEFGVVAVQLEQTASDLRATLSSRDPGFAVAAQTALAERVLAAASDGGTGSSRNSEQFSPQQGLSREPGGGGQGDARGWQGRPGTQAPDARERQAALQPGDATGSDSTPPQLGRPGTGRFA